MDRLPAEVVLQILQYLDLLDLIHLQLVSRRYLLLARDNATWKSECFDRSQAERLRRRQHLLNIQDPRLAALRTAVTALPDRDGADSSRIEAPASPARSQRARALSNWDPSCLGENIDYYEEYIQRHAPIHVAWLDAPPSPTSAHGEVREATGLGLYTDQQDSSLEHAVLPYTDGRVCIWDLSARATEHSGGRGRLIAQSEAGLLTGLSPRASAESHARMTETGAVECVAIDSVLRKGYFAVQNQLREVDLNTLQLLSTRQYPFPITALSEAKPPTPLTVGTNLTVHLFDARDPAFTGNPGSSGGELIGGSVYSHATLAQPGALSIIHQGGEDGSIWVAGRFTSLLQYDRRFFPRLRSTVFSGAKISCMSPLPYVWRPRNLNRIFSPDDAPVRRQHTGDTLTIMAAGEYKGKGSLEFYSIPPTVEEYRNRQTASASKLLSVASHGGRLVFSDGDGNLKWMERDGFLTVRTYNINDASEVSASRPGGIFTSTGTDMPGQGDMVQKIVPLGTSLGAVPGRATGRFDINQNRLLLWTGDGRLGVLAMGQSNPLGDDEWHDAMEEPALGAKERALADAERQHSMAMRRALERQADEVRFVRGLGMGYTPS